MLHSTILVSSLWRVFSVILPSPTDMPSLTTVSFYKKNAFRKKKIVHTKSPSSISPSFLDITPALSHYLSFPLSFTLNNTIITNTPLNRRKQTTHKDIQQTPIRHKREAQLLHSHHKRLFLAHGELRPIAIHNVELSLKYRNQPLVLPLLESHREIGVGMRQVHRERVVQHVKVRIYASCHRSTATQRADVVHVLHLVASVVDK